MVVGVSYKDQTVPNQTIPGFLHAVDHEVLGYQLCTATTRPQRPESARNTQITPRL